METTTEEVKTKKFNFKTIDLLTAESSFLLSLRRLTVPHWSAQRLFSELADEDSVKKNYSFMQLRMAYDDKKPVAWSLLFSYSYTTHKEMWLYTSPEYRRLGLQKRFLIQYWKKKFGYEQAKNFSYQAIYENQKKAFSYLLNKKERDAQKAAQTAEKIKNQMKFQFVY